MALPHSTKTKRTARTRRRVRPGARSAFTLIELLTTIAIIGMLSSISIVTVRSSVEAARTSQTETTIAKIDSALTAIYEKYQYRRVDLSGFVEEYRRTKNGNNPNFEERVCERVRCMRDLLRCDLPCSPSELNDRWLGDGNYTPLQDAYSREIARSNGGLGDNANAELLYLVVTNADPETRSSFSDREIADTDGNGLFEFVDGWKNPICWFRWAPGLETSDRQPTVKGDLTDKDGNFVLGTLDVDPFNPLQLSVDSTLDETTKGWFLVPYVFSAGPDGEYGLIPPKAANTLDNSLRFSASRMFYDAFNDPDKAPGAPDVDAEYSPKRFGYEFDSSIDSDYDNAKTHKDNLDNHTLVR